MRGRFSGPLRLEYLDGRRWIVLEPLGYRAHDGRTFGVPPGFVTDFASVPRPLWNLLPPTGEYGPAAVIHDRLYFTGEVSRADADLIFRQAMGDLGVSAIVRWAMYLAVRAGGRRAWRGYRDDVEQRAA